jgi:hypothetical protein
MAPAAGPAQGVCHQTTRNSRQKSLARCNPNPAIRVGAWIWDGMPTGQLCWGEHPSRDARIAAGRPCTAGTPGHADSISNRRASLRQNPDANAASPRGGDA